MQTDDLYTRLSETSLLQGFSGDEIRRIADAGYVREVEAGTVLMPEGSDSDSLIVLLEGEAEVLKGKLSRPHRLAIVGKGTVLGEIGLLLEVPRTGTVRAISPCQIFLLYRNAFLDLLDEGHSAGFKMCLPISKVLAARLQGLTDEVVKILSYNDALLDILDLFRKHYQSRDGTDQIRDVLLKRAETLRARQDELRKQLCIEIDQDKKARQVAEITKSEYFQALRKKVKALKNLGEDN